ncbi:MAG TPA: site-specific integrase [Massilia sp.]|nr:site-specific integrase [Massilia sp.]
MSANLFKKGRIWHFRFQVGGARVQRSTRLTSKGKAEELAQREYAAAIVRANGGEPVPTLAELADAWLVVHSPVASAAHIRSVDTFRRLHMYELAEKPIGDITTKDVELARVEHLKTHAPSSANHWLRILKLLTMWAVKRDILPAAPWRVKMLKVQKRPRAFLPVDVAKTWFDAVDEATRRSPSVGTAVRLMFGLGLRESEAASARWEWMDWERSTYTPGITKGREADPVPMPAWLREHLEPLRQVEGLIVTKPNGQGFAPGFARQAMRQANRACSVKGITPHRLRGTFATLLSEAGVPIQTIQRVMRHKSHATTMGYLENNLGTAAKAADVIGEKAGFGGAKVARALAESL